MSRLQLSELENTRTATAFLIDNKKITARALEIAIEAGDRWISSFLGRKGAIPDPGFMRVTKLNNYIYDNFPEAFEAVMETESDINKEAA